MVARINELIDEGEAEIPGRGPRARSRTILLMSQDPSEEPLPRSDPMSPADFARLRHAGQVRKGTELPYVVHPEGVARILRRYYPNRADLEAAGWLHDTIEDTATTAEEVEARFGPDVRRLVEGVTRRDGEPFHAPQDHDVMRLKAADALDNVTMTIDGLQRGEQVFERFKSGPDKVRYWREIAVAADHLLGPEPLVSELGAAVTEVEAYVPIAADDGVAVPGPSAG